MKRSITIVVYIFAFIGLVSILIGIISFFRVNREAKTYIRNCSEVKVGMTLEKAKLIMGDLDEKNKTRSEIWTSVNSDTIKQYFLRYPPGFGASSSPAIYFDPNAQIVTKVYCGE